MDRARIEHLARLAGLDLAPDEIRGLAADLARLDALVSALPPLPAAAAPATGAPPPDDVVPPCPWDPDGPGRLRDLPAPAADEPPEAP